MENRKSETRRNGLIAALFLTILGFSCGNNDNPAGPSTQPPTALPDLTGNIVVTPDLDDTIPTAFVNHVAKLVEDDAGGIASVRIQNNNSATVQLTVQCEVEGYTTQASKTVSIPGNTTDTISLTPLVTETAFQSLTENKTVNYRTKVFLQSGGTSNEFYNQTHTAQMLAKDAFVFYDDRILPLMALWVTPHIPKVEELISKAVRRNPYNSFIGYQNSLTKDGYRSVSTPYSGTTTVTAGNTVTAKTFTYAFNYVNCKASGSFTASGGSGNDIKATIEDAQYYYYQSGQVHSDYFTKYFDPGTYSYKFDNTFSWFSTKTVTWSLTVSYKEDLIYPQVKALYDALKNDYRITYVNSPISYPEGTQRVRFPSDALTLGSANCIDGTVLFASALENIALEPIIVLVPGHAFVGWKRWTDANDQCEFLETTMIGNSTFEAAYNAGMSSFTQHQNAGDLITIDVKAARAVGLTPLMKRAAR